MHIAKQVKLYFAEEKDREYGLKVSTRAKELIFEYIKSITNGADFNWLETQSQKNKQSYDILDKYYDLLLYEAPYILDSYILYIEKTDLRKKDFTSLEEKHSNKLPISCRNLKMENLTNCLFTCRQGLENLFRMIHQYLRVKVGKTRRFKSWRFGCWFRW